MTTARTALSLLETELVAIARRRYPCCLQSQTVDGHPVCPQHRTEARRRALRRTVPPRRRTA